MRGTIPLLSQYAFMAWSGTNLLHSYLPQGKYMKAELMYTKYK